MNSYKIAVINGDGIGHEIVPVAVTVLKQAAEKHGFALEFTDFPYGAGYYKQFGDFMPEDGLEKLSKYSAILFGAVGLPDVDDTLPAMRFTFKVRTAFRQYVNYRPAKLLPGIPSPLRAKGQKDIDFVVIRENNEGEFVQNGKILYPEMPYGLAMDTSVFTRAGIERIAHFAFRLARKRRNRVTNVTKSNTLINGLSYWDRVIREVGEQYPDVELRKMYIDNAVASFVLRPEVHDVILTTNLFGDILSDLGGAIMGSLGLGGSGNINPEKDFPSMFEPIHGSAPDIAGKGIANPIGTVASAALMLEHLGEAAAALDIMRAIEAVTQAGVKTIDLGGSARTADVGNALLEVMARDHAPVH
jgi:tartrate dehydrogenase/decarboxylase / D-malate dehydrogenase